MKSLVVREHGTGIIIRLISSGTERALKRTERGLNINMNHEEYYSEIIDDSELLAFKVRDE
jgi:hypothetical protein